MSRDESLAPHQDHFRGALISIGVGVAISGVWAAADRAAQTAPFLLHGAVTGLLIYFVIALLHGVFGRILDRIRSPRRRTAAEVALFVVGGTIGFSLAMGVAVRNLSRLADPRFIGLLMLTVAIVVGVGLGFRSFTQLNARLREREWAEKELTIARAMQERLLPPPLLEGNGYSIAARNLPAQIVAGDFYDFVRLDDGSIVVVVADVAGKGLGASLIMASVKAVLPFVAHQSVASAMSALNDKLVRELARREFVALTYARFDPHRRRLELCNAGFPDPYLLRHGTAEALAVTGMRLPLGVKTDIRYESTVTELARGDRVLFISDGIPEAIASTGESLGYDAVASIIPRVGGASASAWLDAFLTRIREDVGESRSDDWTAVLLECR